MFYRIIPDKETKGKLYVPKGFIEGHFPANVEAISISAGPKKGFAQIVRNLHLNNDEISISGDIIDVLQIPTEVQYQVNFCSEGIRLGPVIGLLMSKSRGTLVSRKPDELLNYTLLYPQIQGLLIAFSADGIDFANKTVKGYYFKPRGKRAVWEEKVLPFPDSIFSRVMMPYGMRLLLKEATSNHFFNSSYFDKWEFWKVMSRFNSTRALLPYSRPFSSMDDVDYVIEHYGSAYLKPLNGTLSRGLIRVSRDKDHYSIKFKQDADATEIASRAEASELINSAVKGRRYLVQQALKPINVEGRHIDFRVIMQKDHTLEWMCTGIISFIGNPGSICSNWGSETTFEEVLAKYLNFSQEEIFKKRQEVINTCKKVCKVLDLTGENFGDLGFDVLIDDKLKVWVLEANKKHYHSVPLWINDVQTFYAVKTNPIKYAAAQSGFSIY